VKACQADTFYYSVRNDWNFYHPPLNVSKERVVKRTGSILFLKNGLKKFCRKNYKNHLRRNNYEECTAVAHCNPNTLDVIVLENIIQSED
jgi:hypothetical protein